jgi:hypothetical protein
MGISIEPILSLPTIPQSSLQGDDVIPIVDVHDLTDPGGTTKQATVAGLLATANVDNGVYNVVAAGADPTGVADSTTAFTNTFTSAGNAGGVALVPPGTYKLTSLAWPNTQFILQGCGINKTILQFSGNQGSGNLASLYLSHFVNTNGSRFSQIRDLQITTTAGNTALRINNLGTHLSNVWCRGGAIGIEANSMVTAMWQSVIASGTVQGVILQNAGTDASTNDVVWLNDFQAVSVSAIGAVGITVGANAGQNGFTNLDAEQCATGIRCIAGGLQRNLFKITWCEQCTVAWVTEDTACSNLYLNQYVRTADGVSQTFGTTTGYQLGNIIASPSISSPTVTSGLTVSTGNETITAGNLNLSNGVVGIGSSAASIQGIRMLQTLTGGVSQTGILVNPTFDSGATTLGYGINVGVISAAAAFTMATGAGVHIGAPTIGAGSSITTLYGLKIENQTGGGTNYAIFTGTGPVKIGDAFGCNGATPQTAAASGGAVTTTAPTQTTPWGFSTSAQATGIITLLNNIRAALVANGIMS